MPPPTDDARPLVQPTPLMWAQRLNWRHAPYPLSLEQREQCVRHGLPGGRYHRHPQRQAALRRVARPDRRRGPLRPGSRWDVAPSADVVTQIYGCVDTDQEWVCPGCLGAHRFHAGIDLGYSGGGWAIYRSPVVAPRSGVVAAIGIQYLGESAVAIQCDDGAFLEFGHLDEAWAGFGVRVGPGEVIGLMGTKGASTAPHLHVELRADGPWQGVTGCPYEDATRDPSPYLNGIGAPATFTVEAIEGAQIRTGASLYHDVVRRVAAGGETLTVDTTTHGGDPIADAWTGTPDNGWFGVTVGGWIASAVCRGNPPAGWTHEVPWGGPPGTFQVDAIGAAHIRSGPSVDSPVLRDVADAGERLLVWRTTHGGAPIADNWTGAPNDEWFDLGAQPDGGYAWIASAVAKGEPPAGWGGEVPYPLAPPAPPAPEPEPTPEPSGPPPVKTLPAWLVAAPMAWETSPTVPDYAPADFPALADAGIFAIAIKAANGNGTGSRDRVYETNWATRGKAAAEAGLAPVPWSAWYGAGGGPWGGVDGDVAAYLMSCAEYTAEQHALMDPKPGAWAIDAENLGYVGLGAALRHLAERTQVPILLTGFGDPITAGVRWPDWAEINEAIAAYLPQMYTFDWRLAMSFDRAALELQQVGLTAPLMPILDEVESDKVAEVVLACRKLGVPGISVWYWSGPAALQVMRLYEAEWEPTPPPPAPPPPPPPPFHAPPPGALAWLEAVIDWLRRTFGWT